MYKNQLQELAQRSCFNLPSYACIREGPDHAPRFKATVNFNGETFESPTFCSTLRQAEHAAAEVALNTLSKRGPSRSLAAKVLDETGIYKNLLQETAHRAGLKLPVYTTIRSGPGHTPVFTCTVELAGMSFTGDPAKTKKQAQKNAAMAAWSALKKLPHLGSPSSSSPTLEHEGNDEQEQVTIARALASLHQSQGNKLNFQNDRQRNRRRPAPIRKDMHPAANISFYPMPFQGWTYPSFSPEAAMYQMWQQAQASQQQAHLLTLPAPSHPINPRLIPTLRSVYQPTQGQFFPSVEQDSVSSVPCFTESAPVLPVYFSDYSVSVPPKSQSQVTIQEIQEEQNQGEGKEWLNLPSEAAVFSSFDISDSNLPLDDAGPVPQVQEPLEDKEGNGSRGSTEVIPGRQINNAPGLKPVVPTSNPSRVQDSTDVVKIQESQQVERSQRKPFEWVPGASIWPGPSTPNRPPNLQQNVNSFNHTQSALGVHHPSSRSSSSLPRGFRPLIAAPGTARTAVPAPIRSSSPRAEALRPRVPSLAAPVTIRTAVPVCSARPGAVNPSSEVSRASFMAPAVHVRSVIPVCSAPPSRKPDSTQRGTQEPECIAAVNSELGELQI
ncbi:double-stranded RNA-binding protein 2 [Elaeis guineensis]|uniref:Double-stranded RNA-binding protein 2 n=1 Tax=Elaeis guineensis var. tenera TaxID=51953 RepID=A0A6J0PA62_ELAGV|nr:double-stranded RNA-binding protein 2 [Elaeis guineensis]